MTHLGALMPPAASATPRAGVPGEGRVPSVLVVDDEASVRLGCVMALRSDGWRAVGEGSPRAALARLQGGERFDVIVLDYAMPELDGLAFTKDLYRISRPSILLASAHADGTVVRTALLLGIWDFQAKPLLPDELRRRVRRLHTRATDAATPTAWLARALLCCQRCAWADALKELQAWPEKERTEPADLIFGLVFQLAGDEVNATRAFKRANWPPDWQSRDGEGFVELARRLG
ncbi:MAG: response regulator [Opitutaceae bacterium]